MKRLAFALPLLLAAGCATGGQPYAPVRDVAYQAIGAEPFWMLAIGDGRIVLRSSTFEGERAWPRTLPRTVGGFRTWRSEQGGGTIIVESRPGPCETEGEEVYEDNVRVTVGDQSLTGCGGRLVRGAPR
ncbi:MAG: hypothetical protein QOD42_910 [Sphingomonadales bacterium]|jgi:uncharacterized membrane protein|nr:hypothetical protein [Sphingomonadales bacterium]